MSEKNTPVLNYHENGSAFLENDFQKAKGSAQGRKINWQKELLDLLKVIVIAFIATNLLNVFVFTLSQVRQSSMEKTLIEKDRLIVEKLSYQFVNPKRGDVVVFISQDEKVDGSILGKFTRLYEDLFARLAKKEGHFRLVKRVVAEPGDVVDIENGIVYVNDIRILEEYLEQPTMEKNKQNYPLVVPDGQFFVMGDNRQSSYDSRDFGCIRKEQIEGKVWLRIWPFRKIGGI